MRSREIDRRTMLRVFGAVGAAVGLGAMSIAEMLRLGRLTRVRRTEARLGTLVTIEILHEDGAAARRVVDEGFQTIRRLEGVLSRHDPGSLLSRLNRDGELEHPDPALVTVLHAARTLSSQTSGAFDVTVGPLLELYERTHGALGRRPSEAEIEQALGRVGHGHLRVTTSSVVLEKPDMRVTLDGIGKGYVVDQVVAGLRQAGVGNVLVDAGGDIASTGGDGGSGWPVSVELPPGTVGPTPRVRLQSEAVATSGDYMRVFTQDRRSHHIIDPRSGRSPEGAASVSVRAPTAMEADGLSTAAMIMGLEAGTAFLDGMPGVEGMLVGKRGEIRTTAGWGCQQPR